MKSVSRNKLNVLFSKKSDKIDNVSVFRKPASTTITQARKPLPPQDLTQSLHVAGDGDRARCCRLCGGDSDLKYFVETCVWEGVEEQYGQLVYDCFGVKVTPSDSMVCEWCIRALRTTQKLRALVRAAFDKRRSDMGIMAAATSNSTMVSCKTATSLKQQKLDNQQQLRKKTMPRRPIGTPLPSRRREPTKKWINNDMKNIYKRVNVNCERCRQRYPTLVPNGEPLKPFLCARCKKDGESRTAACKQCGVIIALNLMRAHTELHAKANARARARNRQLKKQLTPTPTMQLEMLKEKKYKCSKCPKRFNIAANLAAHVLNAHEESNTYSNDTQQNESEATPATSTQNLHTVTPLETSDFQFLFKNQRVQNLSANPQIL